MFPTFTGSSRKSRNVNLSGQKAINPFTSTSWAPSGAAGASKTVAHAQAERHQRQHERDKLKAAQHIQKSWRGHQIRRNLRTSRRQIIDQMYAGEGSADIERRTVEATPLVLSVYQASDPNDNQRLSLLARDLLQTKFAAFDSGAIEAPRLGKLARMVVAALERLDPNAASPQVQILLETITEIIRARPQSLRPVLGNYYKMLGKYCHSLGSTSQLLESIRTAVGAPLVAPNVPESFTQVAYYEFAVSFLTQPELFLFEANVGSFAAVVDVDRLSDSLHDRMAAETRTARSQAGLMWLLAHFVVLQKARKQLVLHSRSLKVLYSLLSSLSTEIRVGFLPSTSSETRDVEEVAQPTLPPYVSDKLASLTDRDEISGLLEKFTSEHGDTSSSEIEDAGFLAGYILTLMYCFPTFGDDIRMRLYLADIPTRHGPLPAVKFFWKALSRTSIFSKIASNGGTTLDILRRKPSWDVATGAEVDFTWHREWRTILLFLELYIFVLRLTDDDDFFSGLGHSPSSAASGSRLRLSSLNLEDLKRLTLFLKHLGFTLYHNAAELLGSRAGASNMLNALDGLSTSYQPKASGSSQASGASTFVLTAGVDFNAFRNLVSTAMKMLYERDSRRQFLPQNHWLMTSKFDMDGFLSAVVLEEQRQRELAESEDEEMEDDEDEEEPMHFTHGGLRLSRQAQMEKIRLLRKRAARDNLRAAISPKLEVLRNMPFVIPFNMRVKIFRQFVHIDKYRRRGGNIDPDRWRFWVLSQHGEPMDPSPASSHLISRHQAQIQRGRVFPDAVDSFWDLKDGLKEPIQITFVDEFGIPEAGIDGGGVTKEFLTSVTTEAFTQDQKLFITNNKNSYYPNPCAMDQQKHSLREVGVPENSETWRESIADLMQQYEFLGRIIGKCLYEGILIDISFAGFFLLKWTSAGAADTYRANINDLRELDEELYQGMLRLKTYPGDVSDLSLDFTITDQISLPDEPVRTITRPLIPNGENTPVTNENRPLYISYVARHRLMVQPHAQTRAFLRGLGLIIDPAWLSMFNQNELQRLVGGDSSDIDVEDLRRHTVYGGVYQIGDDGEEHPTVKLFWEVMHGLEDRQRRDVLKYVTSTPRAPLLGFGQLSPPFSIRDGGLDEERLPSASTCVNLLKLPQYRTREALRAKLLYAVSSGAGFDLS